MEYILERDVDSTAEITKVFNSVIDNQNRIEGMVLELIAKKKPTKKKGGKDD